MAGSALATARLAKRGVDDGRGLGGSVERSQVNEMQRARLMAGAVSAIEELGYAHATVGQITSRARVSRRTFYELFADRDECLAAVLQETAALVESELADAGVGGLAWRERVRRGLQTILVFLDRESALARVCVVHTLNGDPALLARREELLARLVAVVDEGRLEGARGAACGPLTAEGVVGAAFAIVHARLSRGERGPLTGLAGELTGMIVLPYLGPAAARQEQARPAPAVSELALESEAGEEGDAGDLLAGVRLRLTYRTARVLEAIAQPSARGHDPSNREVAAYAGIVDPGQVSKLLRRLERIGLIVNSGGGHAKGEPNAWSLTPLGGRVTSQLSLRSDSHRVAA
jgi:AcrR family transcriptional regulator